MSNVFSNNQSTDSVDAGTNITGPLSAFGEMLVAEPTPMIQSDFVYGINTRSWEQFTATGGSVSAADGKVSCQSGVSIGGFGLIRTINPIVYRPGQGVDLRFTARFSDGVSLGTQRAGAVQAENEISFGYDGNRFGILRRSGGALEIQTLTLSLAAGGAETATVTLDGTVFTPALTGAGTVQDDARELASASYTGWTAHQLDDSVIFISSSVGDKTGSFSYSSTETSAGAFAETRAGKAPTDNWVYQSDWNIDKMDGTGVSGMTFTPEMLNVYRIEFQYLGAGNQFYSIEHAETGRFQHVHILKYAGSSTEVSTRNPSFKLGWFAASLGSTTNLTIEGASCAAFIQGKKAPISPPWSAEATKSGVTTTLTSLLTLKVSPVFKDVLNNAVSDFIEVEVTSALSGNNTAVAVIYLNATIGGAVNFQEVDSDSMMWLDTAGTTVTGGFSIWSKPLERNGKATFDLTKIAETLSRADTLTIAVRTNGGTGEFEGTAVWEEVI